MAVNYQKYDGWYPETCPYTLLPWVQLFKSGVRVAVVMATPSDTWKAFIDGDVELIYYPSYETLENAKTWVEATLENRERKKCIPYTPDFLQENA